VIFLIFSCVHMYFSFHSTYDAPYNKIRKQHRVSLDWPVVSLPRYFFSPLKKNAGFFPRSFHPFLFSYVHFLLAPLIINRRLLTQPLMNQHK
jgi:hypothetical protein